VRDIVRHGETGVLFAPGDVHDLGAAVAGLLGDAERRDRLARNGRAYVLEHFDWGRIAAHYRELMDELVRA
jgi:glycosyltransferase involved in cell wall biosynthesis